MELIVFLIGIKLYGLWVAFSPNLVSLAGKQPQIQLHLTVCCIAVCWVVVPYYDSNSQNALLGPFDKQLNSTLLNSTWSEVTNGACWPNVIDGTWPNVTSWARSNLWHQAWPNVTFGAWPNVRDGCGLLLVILPPLLAPKGVVNSFQLFGKSPSPLFQTVGRGLVSTSFSLEPAMVQFDYSFGTELWLEWCHCPIQARRTFVLPLLSC